MLASPAPAHTHSLSDGLCRCVQSVSYHSNGHLVLSAHSRTTPPLSPHAGSPKPGCIKLWADKTWQCLSTIQFDTSTPISAAFSPDGTMVAIDEYGGVFERPSLVSVHAFDGKVLSRMAEFPAKHEQHGRLTSRERTIRYGTCMRIWVCLDGPSEAHAVHAPSQTSQHRL